MSSTTFKHLWATAVLLFLATVSFAQTPYITQSLQERLSQSNQNDYIRIRIEFHDNVDAGALAQRFHETKLDVDQRPRIMMRLLMTQANESQQKVLDALQSHQGEYKNLLQFWLVNLMVLEVKPSLVQKLQQEETISLIDLEENRIIFDKPMTVGTPTQAKAVGGIEPGLAAINAPAMWDLGYTGKGRKAYVYDTGTWPTHPAISSRFLGNGFSYDQTWTSFYDSPPSGAVNNHGTHVCGTIMGLDTANADTIGVAFKGYWIANDFVTSTVGGLPPLTEMIGAFEWGMNPDGDTATTYDIPDVINNSWRWYDDPDTVHCGGFIVNLMDAIEAIGIANVFSGGNFGPSNTTISSPQRINSHEVNTFSVGSVNGNNASLPISSFSSRGPKQCPGSGALAIHPEVVAPGENVRSAWGTDEYNTISGTSMASPHVSGAVLLLKEAYPMASGREILEALYYSAVDLGVAGEDNVFGNGVIDVLAAYNYLGNTYTPVPPIYTDDLRIEFVSQPEDPSCYDGFIPNLVITNLGSDTVFGGTIYTERNDEGEQSLAWTASLAPGDRDTIWAEAAAGQADFAAAGHQEFAARIIGNGLSERDTFNNYSIIRTIAINKNEQLPFVETFDNGLQEHMWYTDNPDFSVTWDTVNISGQGFSTASAWVNHWDYAPRASQKDGLISPWLTAPGVQNELGINGQLMLKFDYAWQQRSLSGQLQDTLRIFVATDPCADSYNWTQIYENASATLSTHDTSTNDFYPTMDHHWGHDSIDLSSIANQLAMVLKFETSNRQGNNLFLDNVMVYAGTAQPTVVDEPFAGSNVLLFPNPTEGTLNLQFTELSGTAFEVELYDIQGRQVNAWAENTSNGTFQLDISEQATGLYILRFSNGIHTQLFRVVKN